MALTRIVGDIHGKYRGYWNIVKDCERSIQVGDFGLGFGGQDPEYPPQHRFIRGNHDNPAVCRVHPNFIPDGTVDNEVMFIGGAWSIDYAFRTEGKDWWKDEELSLNELNILIDKAIMYRPKIMITHDCPQSIAVPLFNAFPMKTRTQQALQSILEAIRPETWIFGHWHKDISMEISGTRFICLNELSHIDMDI